MHHQPGLQWQRKRFRQHPFKIGITPSDANLTSADTVPGTNGGELRQITVCPKGKFLTALEKLSLCDDLCRYWVAIVSNQPHLREVCQRLGFALGAQLALMRVKADHSVA